MRYIPKSAEGERQRLWEGEIFLLPITPRAPFVHASRDWGRVSLSGVANVRSGARSSKVPIINEQTRKVVRD